MSGTTSYKEYVARSYQVMAEDGWSYDRETGCMMKDGSPPVPVAEENRQAAINGCHWAKVEAVKEERQRRAEGLSLLSCIPPLGAAWVAVGQYRALISMSMVYADDEDNDGRLRWLTRMLVRAARHAAKMQLENNRDIKQMMQAIESYERWHHGPGQHGPESHTG